MMMSTTAVALVENSLGMGARLFMVRPGDTNENRKMGIRYAADAITKIAASESIHWKK